MKKVILTSVFLVAIIFVTTLNAHCQTKEEMQAKIENLNAVMIDAMLNGDYEKYLALYDDNAISLPSYEPMLVGIDEIRESSEANANSGMKITSFEMTIEELMMSGDQVVEIGKYNMTMKMPGMDNEIKDNGKYLTVWEVQKDGSLKMKADTWNTDHNPWTPGTM